MYGYLQTNKNILLTKFKHKDLLLHFKCSNFKWIAGCVCVCRLNQIVAVTLTHTIDQGSNFDITVKYLTTQMRKPRREICVFCHQWIVYVRKGEVVGGSNIVKILQENNQTPSALEFLLFVVPAGCENFPRQKYLDLFLIYARYKQSAPLSIELIDPKRMRMVVWLLKYFHAL